MVSKKRCVFASLFTLLIRERSVFLGVDNSLCGAVLFAGAAPNALLRIDNELAFFVFYDCLCGAVLLAGAALNAVRTNNKCHCMYLLFI